MRTSIRILIVPVIATAVALAGCATQPSGTTTSTSTTNKTAAGALLGAAGGALIGGLAGGGKGAAIGAAAGAVTGGIVGNYMDRQQRELETQLAAERQRGELDVERVSEDLLRVSLRNDVTFDFDSADVKPEFRPTIQKVGTVLRDYDQTVVHVVGHTDNVGSDAYNQQLSERRADAVASYIAMEGVDRGRLLASGMGESQPVTSNATDSGRAANRRVEIYMKPIVEGREREAYVPPY